MNDKDKFKIIKKVNNLEEYKKALSEGLDINFIDNYGKNALFYSNYETAKFLINNGININVITKDGHNALTNKIKDVHNLYGIKDDIYLYVNLLFGSGINIKQTKKLLEVITNDYYDNQPFATRGNKEECLDLLNYLNYENTKLLYSVLPQNINKHKKIKEYSLISPFLFAEPNKVKFLLEKGLNIDAKVEEGIRKHSIIDVNPYKESVILALKQKNLGFSEEDIVNFLTSRLQYSHDERFKDEKSMFDRKKTDMLDILKITIERFNLKPYIEIISNLGNREELDFYFNYYNLSKKSLDNEHRAEIIKSFSTNQENLKYALEKGLYPKEEDLIKTRRKNMPQHERYEYHILYLSPFYYQTGGTYTKKMQRDNAFLLIQNLPKKHPVYEYKDACILTYIHNFSKKQIDFIFEKMGKQIKELENKNGDKRSILYSIVDNIYVVEKLNKLGWDILHDLTLNEVFTNVKNKEAIKYYLDKRNIKEVSQCLSIIESIPVEKRNPLLEVIAEIEKTEINNSLNIQNKAKTMKKRI